MAARWTPPPIRDPDDLLRWMMNVRAEMERDGWGPAMRARDAMPADWHPTAEQLRFIWWRDYGVPEPEPEPEPLTPEAMAGIPVRLPRKHKPTVPVTTNGLGGTRRDGLRSLLVALGIIVAALVWAAILDGTVGLDTLRRLLGWTLY